ncbi:MAG: hypothetical protein ABR568_09815 [Pyrinomonadaceae bacterium]
MLYAELHGKLDDTASDLERREDILTSTVFGTLLVAGATEVLAKWFNSARCLSGTPERLDLQRRLNLPYEDPESWFWPSLSYAQPDIMLRIGSDLLVVEAKYGSTKSVLRTVSNSLELQTSSDGADPDQLVREWLSVQRNARGFKWYPSEIRSAIELCSVHIVYLVSTRKESTALREISEARAKICKLAGSDVPLWLLTWQGLHRVLTDLVETTTSLSIWTKDLIRLLERRYLGAFLGFPRTLANFDHHSLDRLHLTARECEKGAACVRGIETEYFDSLQQVNFDAIGRVAQYWRESATFVNAWER